MKGVIVWNFANTKTRKDYFRSYYYSAGYFHGPSGFARCITIKYNGNQLWRQLFGEEDVSDSNSFNVESMEEVYEKESCLWYGGLAAEVMAVTGTAVCPAYATESSEAVVRWCEGWTSRGRRHDKGGGQRQWRLIWKSLPTRKITLVLEESADKRIETSMAEVGLSWAKS